MLWTRFNELQHQGLSVGVCCIGDNFRWKEGRWQAVLEQYLLPDWQLAVDALSQWLQRAMVRCRLLQRLQCLMHSCAKLLAPRGNMVRPQCCKFLSCAFLKQCSAPCVRCGAESLIVKCVWAAVLTFAAQDEKPVPQTLPSDLTIIDAAILSMSSTDHHHEHTSALAHTS